VLSHARREASRDAGPDLVSGGRFAFGGEFPGEFAAAGVPVNQRGALE